jgi:TonB family protein
MFVDANDLALIAQSTGLTIDTGKKSVTLATGKLQLALDAAAKCNDDLIRSWGVDPTAKATPVGNPGEWFTDDDYPPIALKRHVQGHVKIALTVDTDGKIKGCRIVATSGDPDLDRGTCDVAKTHARYIRKSGGDRFDILAVEWAFANR